MRFAPTVTNLLGRQASSPWVNALRWGAWTWEVDVVGWGVVGWGVRPRRVSNFAVKLSGLGVD